ncbi:thioesterase [Micromonospora sp. WMMD1120]|uniref:thioesterase n=1 Tax=Micromonospora sp. WMMD1120 TaxID=3016106 RepID=UPI0024176B17|nr:thioesterase [Micromonospora sp. WMMD1120]MDG4810808.1 thioesterase [Micromonospora sp. WMMD1120]
MTREAPPVAELPDSVVKNLLETSTTSELRPGYEGANIGTIIGFKHVNYLIEQGIIEHFRAAGAPVGRLYDEHGLGFDLLELDTRLQTALLVDDIAAVEVVPHTPSDSTEFVFKVQIRVVRDDAEKKAVTSTARAVLRRDDRVTDPDPIPEELGRFVTDHIGNQVAESFDAAPAVGHATAQELSTDRGVSDDPVIARLTEGRNAFGWKWRMPYFYCHFFERVQMSGYLRQMEEVVDRFLAARGLSIKPMLDERNWIPAVTRSHVRILDETVMEEELYTVYTVESIFKDLLYTSTMDCYVLREGRLLHTATGTITHAYGVVENGREGRLVNFDDRVLRALEGSRTGTE